MTRRYLNDIGEDIAFTNQSKGFDIDNIDQKLLLVVSEICEAQNELRKGRRLNEIYYDDNNYKTATKPEGFPIEIADAIIRLLHIAHHIGVDIEKVIKMKLAYNTTRPEKHVGSSN